MQDLTQKILSIHVGHLTTVREVQEALDIFIGTAEVSVGESDSGESDDFTCLIDILRHQPFTPNYASTASPYIAHLSDLLAQQSEQEQTQFLLRVLRVSHIALHPSCKDVPLSLQESSPNPNDAHGKLLMFIGIPGAEDPIKKASQQTKDHRG